MTEPRVSFLIGGVQKGGTSALARCLGLHPGVLLPQGKEAHVFDAPQFDDAWLPDAVNARYAPHFGMARPGGIAGDATPIYLLHERFVQRIARYNPAMRWIVLLRDPVERAMSQYFMERERGNETWPLWAALLFERWRLRGHRDDFSADSPLRTHSYCLRGDYARQLDALYRHFPANQVLLLMSAHWRNQPRETMERVYAHLGLAGPVRLLADPHVFVGSYVTPRRIGLAWRLASGLLRDARKRLRERYDVSF